MVYLLIYFRIENRHSTGTIHNPGTADYCTGQATHVGRTGHTGRAGYAGMPTAADIPGTTAAKSGQKTSPP